jgi:CPA1 family monovalent cation:H+ antiporter
MEGMLAFLLFAGALHVDLALLRNHKWIIGLMASIGVVLSAVIVGGLLYLLARALGFELSLAWAMVFGALISPTDPVAVLGLLKTVNVPDSIKAKIAGESLFNDGVAVVAFGVFLTLALGPPAGMEATFKFFPLAQVLAYEVIGGAAFGFLTGWIAFKGMEAVDDHIVEILISVAACVATYAISHRLHFSGPIAVVITGLFIGNHGAEHAMSEKVEEYLFAFWEVVDEILNSVLFLLLGFDAWNGLFVAAAIPIVLAARLISVSAPIGLLSVRQTFSPGVIPLLTWGGLRGGVSVALALSLPDDPTKPLLLATTYAVVIFSVVVQGLTVKRVIALTIGRERTSLGS